MKWAKLPSFSSNLCASWANGRAPLSEWRLSLGELHPDAGVLFLLGEESRVSVLCLTAGGALILRCSGFGLVVMSFFNFHFRVGSETVLRRERSLRWSQGVA